LLHGHGALFFLGAGVGSVGMFEEFKLSHSKVVICLVQLYCQLFDQLLLRLTHRMCPVEFMVDFVVLVQILCHFHLEGDDFVEVPFCIDLSFF
jgi:hypothetical protein